MSELDEFLAVGARQDGFVSMMLAVSSAETKEGLALASALSAHVESLINQRYAWLEMDLTKAMKLQDFDRHGHLHTVEQLTGDARVFELAVASSWPEPLP